jgi:hypothetical protein
VLVWGQGLPVPRVIQGLDDICWIAGPYAVACNGQLLHADITDTAGGTATATVTPVAGVPAIWRVNADVPLRRQTENPSGDPEDVQVTSLELLYTAIAADGRIFELDGTSASAVPQ